MKLSDVSEIPSWRIKISEKNIETPYILLDSMTLTFSYTLNPVSRSTSINSRYQFFNENDFSNYTLIEDFLLSYIFFSQYISMRYEIHEIIMNT